jgi:O-methyltransferase
MEKLLRQFVRHILNRFNLDIVRRRLPPDLSEDDIHTLNQVRGYSGTPPVRLVALCDAVRYIAASQIPGDIVECGVWKGGSMMAAALTLRAARDTTRHLHLFDTFEGMPEPTAKDISCFGEVATEQWRIMARNGGGSDWAYSPIEDVRGAMYSTGYEMNKIHLIKGRVEDTIPAEAPAAIALLRLDTDWYDSTLHELVHLFPRLSTGGVIIIDDYGHWLGARQATDEYFRTRNVRILLNRIDYTARIGLKM